MAIRINFITQFDNRGIKKAEREIKAIGRSISRSLDVAVAGAIVGATAGIITAVKAASNLAAEYEGVSQVFGDAAKSVQNFAKEASKTAGLSETEALQGAKTLGLFATSAGLSSASAATFSTKLVQLAGDLGSFNDVPTAEALDAIQSGLQGQSEPLRKFGVFLTDAGLKAEAMAMKIYDGKGALTAQQKMLASYSLILKSTNVQQGDFVKYADTFGNSTKTITKDLENLSAEIGQQLLPVIESMLPAVAALIPVLGEKLKKAVASVDWKGLFTVLVNGLTFLIENAEKIFAFVGTVYALSKAFAALKIVLDLVTVSTAILNGTLAVNPYVAIAAGVIILAGAFALLAIDARKANEQLYENTGLDASQIKGRVFAAPGGALAKKKVDLGPLRPTFRSTNTFASNLELKKQMEAAAKAAAATKATVDSQKKAAASAKTAADSIKKAKEAVEALAKETEALADFSKELMGLGEGVKPLIDLGREIGRFEQDTVKSFDAIAESIDKGIGDGTIVAKAGKNLLDYVSTERKALTAIAQKRDELASKRSLAETLIGDVKNAVRGFAQITDLVKNETGNLVSNFTDVVAKTKTFATQLKQLRELGLDKNLYKQILDAGIEAGGATAAEIIAGGAGTVGELNNLFTELERVGAAIAEDTALVMYNNGVEVAGGLVAGLMSQEQALVNAATALADAFSRTFNSMIGDLKVPSQEMDTLSLNIADIAAGNSGVAGSNSAVSRGLANRYLNATNGQGATTITINVKAGLGTDGKAVGQAIQAELNKYNRSNVALV